MEAADDDLWGAVTTSPSASPPPPSSAAAISTALSLNTRLQLLAASGAVGSPFHPGGGCYRNAAASPSAFFSSAAASFPRIAPLDAGPARRALEREMCYGHGAAAWPAPPPPLPRRRRPRARGPAQEAHDQEPRVGVPLPRAQAGPRHPDRVGGAPAARGERAAPPQVRPAQGFGGGVGAGAEDAAEGALGALLIPPRARGIEIEAAARAPPATSAATTTHIALEEEEYYYDDDRPCKSIRMLLCFPFP